MLILKIILQVLATGIALLINTLDYGIPDKWRQEFKRLRFCLYFFTVLFLLSSIVVTIYDDNALKEERAVLKEELAALKLQSNRNLHRIEDVGIEFRILLPMDNPALAKYSKRVLPIVHSLVSRLPSQESSTWGPFSVPFIAKSPLLALFPDLETERVAYTFLAHVCIHLEIFTDSVRADAFIPNAGPSQNVGDLAFRLSRSAGKTEQNDVSLSFDISENRFLLHGSNAKTGPSQKSTGRIVSVPDLAGATAVVYFCPRGSRDEGEKREFLSIANELQLDIFGLHFSGGQTVYRRPEGQMNQYGQRVYLLKFPKTAKEVEALIQQ